MVSCTWGVHPKHCISSNTGPDLYFLSVVLLQASVQGWPQIWTRLLFQWKEEKSPGMSPSTNAVARTFHCGCAFPDIFGLSSVGAETAPSGSSDKSCLSVHKWTTLSSPKSTCCNSLSNSISAISLISGMLIISYERIVNKVHYMEHRTCGKGCGTHPQFVAWSLFLNIIELPPASKRGQLLLQEDLYSRKYGNQSRVM